MQNWKVADLHFAHTLAHTSKSNRRPHYFWLLGFQDISLAAKDSTAAQLEAIKIKYEEAVELRKKAELEIEAFRPVGYFLLASISLIIKLIYSPKPEW